jgi:hypothetical protein
MTKPAKAREKSTKNSKKKRNFLAKTSKTTNFVFITLLLLAAGAWGWRMHTRASTEYSVRFVLFCPTDSCKGSRSKVDHYGRQARAWYRQQLGGRTFRIYPENKNHFADVVHGGHNSAWYGSDMGSIIGKIMDEGKLTETNVMVVAQLGWSGQNHCGVGEPDPNSGGGLGLVAPGSGRCSGYMNSAFAHELGHTWCLASGGSVIGPPCGHRSDSSLMQGTDSHPAACNGNTLGHCSLNSNDRAHLLNMANSSSWFPTKQARSSVYFQPSDTDLDFSD